MKFLMFLIFFLLIGAFFIISNENIKLDNPENLAIFFNLYGTWVEKIFYNSVTTTGNMIKMEWLPNRS